MENNENKLIIPKWISWGFILLIAILLFNTMDIVTSFLISAIIAWFLNIFAELLEKFGIKRELSVIISFSSCAILILTAILFIIPPLTKQVIQITSNVKTSIEEIHKAGLIAEENNNNKNLTANEKTEKTVEKMQTAFYIFLNGLYEKFPILKENIHKEDVVKFIESKQQEIGDFLVKFVNNAISNVSSFLSQIVNIILIPIFTFYFLVLMKPLKERVNYLINKSPYSSQIKNISENIIEVLENYIRGMITSATLFGITVGIGSYIISLFFHNKYSLVIGCVTIFLSVIPYIGMFLISVIAALIGYFTSGGNLLCCVIMLLMVQVTNFIFDNYISPKIVGESIGIHPLVSIFAILAGGKLFGFWGLVLGSPCAGIIKIFMMKLYPTLFEEIPSPTTTENNETTEDNKQEDNKQEEKKQEDNKQEENKQEDNKQEDNKQEDNKQEEKKQEEKKQEENKQEDNKQEDNKQEDKKDKKNKKKNKKS